ncbi:hypothetical protein HQ529_03905 [Candidatus Woesearchaeota archaeon]|nr:hypothetical protein [Candidatus Woesearchaeota archaeon]
MPRGMFFRPEMIFTELVFSVIIILLCAFIYFKTKEVYELTKHKGIGYFRNAFLFFGLAYLFRFFVALANLADISLYFHRHYIMIISLVFTSFLSTIAILSLVFASIWKKIKTKNPHYALILIAVVTSVLTLVFGSVYLLTLINLGLFLFAIIVTYLNHKKSKKFSQLYIIYILLFVFWIFNLFNLIPNRFISFELRTIGYMVSISIFWVIYHKVSRTLK